MATLIIALDCPFRRAVEIIEATHNLCSWYKLGIRALLDYRYAIIPYLKYHNANLMLDLKIYETPDTVAAALNIALVDFRPNLLTVHPASAGIAVTCTRGTPTRILTVPRLTSSTQPRPQRYYERFAEAEGPNGFVCPDGFVCPVSEAPAARRALVDAGNPVPLIVCPGIRLPGMTADNHKTVATPTDATGAGADFIVVGRPIIDAADPAAMIVAMT